MVKVTIGGYVKPIEELQQIVAELIKKVEQLSKKGGK